MKRASLVSAAVIVIVANAFALLHAWRNRSQPMESDIILTQREFYRFYDPNAEDSGVALTMLWADPQRGDMPYLRGGRPLMLDQKILAKVGFNTSVAPSAKEAPEFYARQHARRAFVALEYDGPAWRKWVEDNEQQSQTRPSPRADLPAVLESSTRLMAIDAGRDVVSLRARHPDRHSAIIVPAVIGIGVELQTASNPARLYGLIQEIPFSIHVPLPFSDGFRFMSTNRDHAKFQVHLRFGALLEPWIVGVDFPRP